MAALFAHLLTGLRRAYGPRPTPQRTPVLVGLALLANAWLVTNFFGLLGGAYFVAAVGKAAVDAGVVWHWWARSEAEGVEGNHHKGAAS
ncbi:hypothetical protein [Hymenobacter sp. B1770]|uniref:hypothetical protein n=1 Tax=Hymenobacter sp. B1770 TaxID=1718788 RepID=UPI003CEF43E2